MPIGAPEPASPAWRLLALVCREPGEHTPEELAPMAGLEVDEARRLVREWRKPIRVHGLEDPAPLVAPRLVRLFPAVTRPTMGHGAHGARVVRVLLERGPLPVVELASLVGGTKTTSGGRVKATDSFRRRLRWLATCGDLSPPSCVWPAPAGMALYLSAGVVVRSPPALRVVTGGV